LGVSADHPDGGDDDPPGGGAVVAGHGGQVQLDVVGAGDRQAGRQFHGDEGFPAPAQAAGGFEVGAGFVDEQVEQFTVLLVLYDVVVASDHGKHLSCAGLGVGAHGGEVVGDLQGGDPIGGDLGSGQRQGADVPPAEVGGGHDLLGGQAVAGDGAELVPGVGARGDERGGAVGEGFDLVCHGSCLSGGIG
jgi:hypothetical protein